MKTVVVFALILLGMAFSFGVAYGLGWLAALALAACGLHAPAWACAVLLWITAFVLNSCRGKS